MCTINARCKLPIVQCKYYQRENEKSYEYWGKFTTKEIGQKRDDWYKQNITHAVEHANPTSIVVDLPNGRSKRIFTGEKYPSSRSIEKRYSEGQVPVDLPTFMENLGMLDDNLLDSENPFQPLLQEVQRMKEEKIINDNDITDMSVGKVTPFDLLVQRQLNSGTQLQEQMYKNKKEKFQKLWDKVVKEVSKTQRSVIDESVKQLKKNPHDNKINKAKIAEKLNIKRSSVGRTLDRIKENFDE